MMLFVFVIVFKWVLSVMFCCCFIGKGIRIMVLIILSFIGFIVFLYILGVELVGGIRFKGCLFDLC